MCHTYEISHSMQGLFLLSYQKSHILAPFYFNSQIVRFGSGDSRDKKSKWSERCLPNRYTRTKEKTSLPLVPGQYLSSWMKSGMRLTASRFFWSMISPLDLGGGNTVVPRQFGDGIKICTEREHHRGVGVAG